MIGPFLVVIGLLLVWVAVRGKSLPLLKALGLDTVPTNINSNVQAGLQQYFLTPLSQALSSLNPFGGGTTNDVNQPGSNSSGSSSGGGGSADIGTHMGIDANGNIITINKTYAAMSAVEKDAANAFAHQFPGGQ